MVGLAVTFAWLCQFRPMMTRAIESQDVRDLNRLYRVAVKQVGQLETLGWQALLDSWRADAETLKQALEHTCESR